MSSNLSLAGTRPYIVGVDVGGTKIAAGVVDDDGRVYGRVKIPTDLRQPEMTLQSIIAAIAATLQASGVGALHIRAVGLGIPGKVDVMNGVCLLAVNLGWRDMPVKQRLEEVLGIPCFLENDVSVAALGESHYGLGRGLENFIYLSLGTGIAARVILAGQLYRGSHGLAGEIGHAIFVPDGPQCLCGARGCLEALASGPALVRQARDVLGTDASTVLKNVVPAGSQLTAEQIFAAAVQGDGVAQRLLAVAAKHLANAVYLLTMAFDPQAVVLGGGMVVAEEPFVAAIRAEVRRLLEQAPIFREMFSNEALLLSGLQLNAGILGAASLARIKLETAQKVE